MKGEVSELLNLLIFISGKFKCLAEEFIKTRNKSGKTSDGQCVPVSAEDHRVFLSMLFETLDSVRRVLEDQHGFERYSHCHLFTRLIVDDQTYARFAAETQEGCNYSELASPAYILRQKCGVFLGSARMNPLGRDTFGLKYSRDPKEVKFHSVIIYTLIIT